MSSKLTVIFFIVLCLEAGVILTLLPWWPALGLVGDWGDNFFLVYASRAAGLPALQKVVASGWVRGAVTGLGVLNFVMAFWEIAHFKQTVHALQQSQAAAQSPPATTHAPTEENAPRPAETSDLPRHERRDDTRHNSVEH